MRMKELKGQPTNQFSLAVLPIREETCTTVNQFLAFLEIYELPGPLIFTNTHVCKLFVRSHGHNTSVYSWKAYPDKHVKLRFTPFLKFFYLHLACMTNIQVVDSRPPSIPAGSCPHFASINLTMELKLEPTRQQFFWHYYCTYLL